MPTDKRPEPILNPLQMPSGGDEPLPDHVTIEAKAAFSRKAVGELAALVFDSLVDGEDTPESHQLRFESEHFHVHVDVSVRPADVVLAGRTVPPVPGRFELIIDGTDLRFISDSSDGKFSFGPIGHGLVRLSFIPEPGPKTQTDWFRV